MKGNHGENDTERGGQGDTETDNEKGESDKDREVEKEPLMSAPSIHPKSKLRPTKFVWFE
jgi:hypothetical protein